MSCNGCRVLRKGCSENCVLRSCLHWIESAEAQGNATLFLAKFFGRSDLMSLISAVPQSQRPALFQSLLYEACGRTVNPVNGAVGLLSSGNWHVCQAAVETVLAGGPLRPIPGVLSGGWTGNCNESSDGFSGVACTTVGSAQPQSSRPSITSHALWEDREPSDLGLSLTLRGRRGRGRSCSRVERPIACNTQPSFYSGESEVTMIMTRMGSYESGGDDRRMRGVSERKLLNLFV